MGRKAKPAPANSGKALQLCGDTSRLGVSAADVFAQFGAPAFDQAGPDEAAGKASVPKIEDAEISLALHALQKKDTTTRLRGVGELRDLLQSRPTEALKEACGPFLHLYRRLWVQDSEARVREGLQRCLHCLVESLQRDFGKHLRGAFPTWLCAMFDTHTEVAQAARRAFASSFTSDDKRRGVFRHCQAQCLSLIVANLRHSEQSLHDELGITTTANDRNAALERQDRYIRVIAASLQGLGELVHVCADDPSGGRTAAPLTAEDIDPFFTTGSPSALWPRLAAKQPPLVRRAATECLVRVLQSNLCLTDGLARSARSAVMNSLVDEAVPPVTAASLLCAFAKAGGAECWDGLDAGKALWPQLLTALSRGGAWDAQFLATLPVLLGLIPPGSWRPGRAEEILRSLLEGGSSKPQAPHGQIWCSFFGVVHAADSAGHPVSDAWRWAPVKLYLGSFASGGKELPALALPSAAMSALPGALDKQLPGLLGREGAGKELLAELTTCAPPHAAQSATEDLAQAWTKWLTLLTILLGEKGGPTAELRDAAAEVLATAARRLFTTAVQWPTGTAAASSVADFTPLLDALGHVLSVESVPLQPSWGAAVEEVGHGFAQLSGEGLAPGTQEELNQGPAEVRILLWPLLPWWRAAILADTVSPGAAAAIGRRVLLPFLRRVVRRLQATDSKLVPVVRDVVVPALLHPHGTAKEEVALHLTVGLQLALECLPEDLCAAESRSFCDAVVHLTELVATGVIAAESTLKLALHPSAVKPQDASKCLEKLVAAAEPADGETSTRAFELGVLCTSILASYGSAAAGNGAFAPFRQTLSSILLRSLVQCHSETLEESEVCAWEALQHVLIGLDVADISKALGSPVASTVCLKRWLRAVREASSAAGAPLSTLLVACRGGLDGLRKRGAIALAELWRSAWVTAELSRGRCADAPTAAGAEPFISPSLAELDDSVAALLWELLLASTVVRRENLTLDAALWDWLQGAPSEIQGQFLRFCVKEAWEEGSTWWLADQAQASCHYGPHALSALRRLLGAVWPDAAAAQQAAGLELVAWALDLAAEEECRSPGSSQVVVAVLERSILVGAPFVMEKTNHSRSQWLAIVRNAAASRTLTSALLLSAAAVERWGKSDAVSGDSELVEVHEQILRWAQNAKAPLAAGSAFAEYTAAVWPSLTSTSGGLSMSSQLVIRMQRFISELLQQGKKEHRSFELPGAFRLADELCQAALLPERSWSEILPAVVEVDSVVRQREEMAEVQNEELVLREQLLPHGMVEDAMEAAVALLRHVPDTVIQRLVPLLSAADDRLQAAAAGRLLKGHAAWLPLGPGAPAPAAAAAAEVLQQMDELLQDNLEGAKAPPPPAAAGSALDSQTAATVNDVAFAVVDAVLGQELTLQLWAVEDALAAFLEWDVGAESESESGEPDSGSESKSGGGGGGGAQHPVTAHEAETNELPADCRRCCVATLAAWELLLTAVHRHQTTSVGESEKSSSSTAPATGSGGTSAAPTQPTELVATALQLVPDQLSRYQGRYTWRTGVAPSIEESLSPVQPLLRLLCHVLTNERLVTSSNLEELLRKGLAHCSLSPEEAEEEPAQPPWDIVSTAGRVLLLSLRAVPGAVRGFWEKLPRRRDRNLVEGLVTRNFTPLLLQAEAAFASAQLQAQKDRLPGIEASVCRRPKQLVLQLSRDEFKAELLMQLPDSFPLRTATAEHPDRMPGIPQPRVRNWMLQARQELAGSRPNGLGRVALMWARSFALFFEGVEDCPICFNVVHLSTQTLPRKSCPTCKNKFHNECLYQWFKSSAKTTCPLCTQPF